MTSLDNLKVVASDAIDYVDANSGVLQTIGVATGGAVIGGAIVGTAVALTSSSSKSGKKSKRKHKKITHTKRGWKQDRARRSKQKWEIAYQRRKRKLHHNKSKSKRGIHYTKNGQPYKIMSNGRARFIKKRGRRSK
jgi:hypothetical protein